MKTSIHHQVAPAQLQQSEGVQPPPDIITPTQVLGLPEPVQRYLRYVGIVGKEEPIRTVRFTQKGFMRTQPGQKWMPLFAEQLVTTNPPAFVWQATIQPFPFAHISATDRFSEGHGNMLIKLLSVIPLGNASGPEIDEGELQRYLAEVVLYPTACLSDAIEWQVINAHSVKATVREAGVVASVVLHVNEQGQLTQVTADRYRQEKGHYLLTPWSAQCSAYQEVDGMRIPTRIEITWHLASGDFTWFRVKIAEIEYNQSGKMTRF